MSFEEWWNTKDYPVRCKGNCMAAYEAGMKADVHTDNSAVIAEFENKIADIKANCDLAIEGRDVKIMELEAELEQAKKVKVVEHFEAFGQCRDSRRIAVLEQQIETMKRYLDCEYCEHYTQPCGCKNCNEEIRSDWKLKEIKENDREIKRVT